MVEQEQPDWAVRLVEAREVRDWTQTDLAEQLQELAPAEVPADLESVTTSIKGWESGRQRPLPRYRKLLARLYGTTAATLFGPDKRVDQGRTVPSGDVLELARRMQRSDLDQDTIDTLVATVDELATRYSADPPEELWRDTSQWLVRHSRRSTSSQPNWSSHCQSATRTPTGCRA